MRPAAAIIAVSLLASSGWARQAEIDTGSHIAVPKRARIPDTRGQDPAVVARIVMADFARCVVDREYRYVERAVNLPIGNDFNRAVAALATNKCLYAGMMKFQPLAMRGPLFKELYVRRLAAETRGRSWGPLVDKISLTVVATGTDEAQVQHAALMDFGACVVSRDRAAANRIVVEATASPAQDEAIKTAVPLFGECLPQGSKVRIGRQMIEAAFAEVLYRGVSTPVPAVNAAVESK